MKVFLNGIEQRQGTDPAVSQYHVTWITQFEPPLPSAVDRLAAVADSEIAGRVSRMNAAHEKWRTWQTRFRKMHINQDYFDQVKITNL